MRTSVAVSLVVLAVVVLVPLVALGTLWSLNTLFGTGLAYSLKNMAAVSILGAVVGGGGRSSK